MKKIVLVILLFLSAHYSFCQIYMPMPTDSGARWRYRIYDIDYITRVYDCIMFLNGKDTVANGNTYHQLISRVYCRIVPNGSTPEIQDVYASLPDNYYGAIREEGKKVYKLDLSGEELLFDFNVAIGDSIPAYVGKNKVTGIDSVFLGGVYHKRYLTTDPTYYTIEGVGSNRGLIPQLADGGSDFQFLCFTNYTVFYAPDSTVPCTYVFPLGYISGVQALMNNQTHISVFPNPAYDVLHIASRDPIAVQATIFTTAGQAVWTGEIMEFTDISVTGWARGVYYLQIKAANSAIEIQKLVLE